MKYLHLFPNEKFTESYIEFINKNFEAEEHLFLIIGNGVGAKITPRKNVKKIGTNFKGIMVLIKEMYKFNKIYVHSLFTKIIILIFFSQPWLLKKANWIVWGGDLYYYKTRKHNIKTNIYEFVRKIVIKNFNGISTLVKGDYDLAKEWYKVKGKYYKAVYFNSKEIEYLDTIINYDLINNDYISIQIGNSASPNNNHIEVLKLLSKYKTDNVRIYCPLSYGDSEYGENVKRYGKSIFGEKFIPVEKFLEFNEYMDFLNTIDVGIFNNDRQQALGNIFSLLYLGKKVYMRNDTSMWNEIYNDLNLKVFSINQLKKDKIETLSQLEEKSKKSNRKIIKQQMDEIYIKTLWQDIFI